MANSIIERAALGRMASVGDLYDASCEHFTGRSLLKKCLHATVMKPLAADSQFVADTFHEKAEKLKIEPELQISILADLVCPSGSSYFLNYTKRSAKAVCCSLICSIHTCTEHLDLFSNESKRNIDRYSLYCRPSEATHVVAEIHWGATSVITMEHPNEENFDEVKITEDLQAALNKVAFCCADSSAILDHCKFDKRVSIHTFSDVPLPNVELESSEGRLELLNKMHEGIVAMSNESKGVPQKFVLVPLCRMRACLNIKYVAAQDIVLIHEPIIVLLVKLYEQFGEIEQKFHDLFEDMKLYLACTTEKDVKVLEETCAEVERARCLLKTKLKELLINIRCGKKNVKELDMLTNRFAVTLQSFVNISKNFNKVTAKISFVKFLKQQDIVFVGRDSPFDFTEMSTLDQLYILFYSEDDKQANTTLWNDNKNLFLDCLHSSGMGSCPDKLENKTICHSMFIVIDTDLRPEIVVDLDNIMSIHVSLYKNGKCIDKDVFNSLIVKQHSGFVRYTQQLQHVDSPPEKRKVWSAACPGSMLGQCSKKELTWFCETCNQLIEHCFDGKLYCKCGGNACGLKSNYTFKCNDDKHVHGYIKFKDMLPGDVKSAKQLNVLVLGETGVGKSTWINAVANYLSFSSLEDAKEHELMSLIGTSFTVMDDNFKEKTVKIGEDSNEELKVGQSATKCPKTYTFQWNDLSVRLIDTPGIGDTRGLQQDAANFDAILRFISEFKELHGICILLKPNNARLGVMFKFCIKELLTYLHQSCSQNIVFCFTNARNTLYRPGDTFPALKKLLLDNKEIKIVLSKDTIYCFDNESFRCLCMLHNNIESDQNQLDLYSASWDRSVAETKRLFEHFMHLKAHNVQETISLNETRRIIVQLTRPIACISQNILANMALVEEKKLEVRHSIGKMKNSREQLHIPSIKLVAVPLGHPRTVCTSPRCVKYHNIEATGITEIEYVTHCHKNCWLDRTKSESCPNPALKGCAVMDYFYNCTHCGCSWDKHMHVTYEQEMRVCKVVDSTADTKLKLAKSDKESVELFVENIENRQKQLKEEQDKLMDACVKFGTFLNTNSLVQHGDIFAEHLATLVQKEKDKCKHGGSNTVLKGIEKMHCQYLEHSSAMKTSVNNGATSKLSAVEMHQLVEELCALPLKGEELKQHIEVATKTSSGASTYNETHCPPPTKLKKKKTGIVYLPNDDDDGIKQEPSPPKEQVVPNAESKYQTDVGSFPDTRIEPTDKSKGKTRRGLLSWLPF